MEAKYVYEELENDFINPNLRDEWGKYIDEVKDFITEEFMERSMGLVCDNTNEINTVYTAVFPTKKVMRTVLGSSDGNDMLFVHHPSIWDIRRAPDVFYQMDRNLLQKFRDENISIYNLHVPLDNYSEYSTSVSLAKVLGFDILKPFGEYFGSLSGVFGKTGLNSVKELKNRFEEVLGHRSSIYHYGKEEIKDGLVAVLAGGGNDVKFLKEIFEEGVNTFVTGITVKNDHSMDAHKFAEEKGINVLGGTHYSTEQFACKKMCEYFEEMGLLSEFVEGTPILEDL
ncbi:MAG: Nif3-like dinuclear metal center hexameric protein [Candidatus Aenigmatarchaeota archaeon]